MPRKYKDASPLDTINNIRNILKELSIFTYEKVWINPHQNIYSTRVECDENSGGFGANGKGTDRLYTLASAYGEFIERLQNGFFAGTLGLNRVFLKQIKAQTGFYYFPDEKIMHKDAFQCLPEEFLNDVFCNTSKDDRKIQITKYFERLSENGEDGVVSVPFYSTMHNTIIHLPYNLLMSLTGSNGMAAGNTPEEGVFQALCEVIERYAVSQVYYNQLTPPTIGNQYLERYVEEYSIIKDIQHEGYIVEVKDFSSGIGLPAIGVIVYNAKKTKYKLNVGAETSFKRALSRALTEIYQGIKDNSGFNERMHDVPLSEYDYFSKNDNNSMAKRSVEIRKFIIDGSGKFPYSLFQEEQSYPFNFNIYNSDKSYQSECKSIISFFHKIGHDVLIRDVSFMGFPSYHIFIPNVSIFGRKTSDDPSNSLTLVETILQDKIEDYFFHPNGFTNNPDILKSLIDSIAPTRNDSFKNVKLHEILKLSFKSDFYWFDIPLNYFLSIACIRLKEYNNAIRYLKSYMEESNNQSDDYYLAVLRMLEKCKNDKQLCELYNIPKEVYEDIFCTENLFKYLVLPVCPDCKNCDLATGCLTKINYEMTLKISTQMDRAIKQECLAQIFSNGNS